MKLITSPNRWDCAACAFAMALDVPLDTLIEFLGHDGGEIINPDVDEPNGRRGFHNQEFIDLILLQNKTLTPYQLRPALSVAGKVVPVDRNLDSRTERFEKIICTKTGVLFGRKKPGGNLHCVAFEEGVIYDSAHDGSAYEFETVPQCIAEHEFLPIELWMIK